MCRRFDSCRGHGCRGHGPDLRRFAVAVWLLVRDERDLNVDRARITDLGIVERVRVGDDAVEIDLLPTFAGCPALDAIREDVERSVERVAGDRTVLVRFVYSPPWTSDRVTPEGREAMRGYGLTPPGEGRVFLPLASLALGSKTATCPFCGSMDTVLESAFGPTLCRSTHFCRACRNAFEAFKLKGETIR